MVSISIPLISLALRTASPQMKRWFLEFISDNIRIASALSEIRSDDAGKITSGRSVDSLMDPRVVASFLMSTPFVPQTMIMEVPPWAANEAISAALSGS
jgi:hypothetical protein